MNGPWIHEHASDPPRVYIASTAATTPHQALREAMDTAEFDDWLHGEEPMRVRGPFDHYAVDPVEDRLHNVEGWDDVPSDWERVEVYVVEGVEAPERLHAQIARLEAERDELRASIAAWLRECDPSRESCRSAILAYAEIHPQDGAP